MACTAVLLVGLPAGVVGAQTSALAGQVAAPDTTRDTTGTASAAVPAGSRRDDAARILADTGTYVYALVPEESDDVKQAIDSTVARMSFIVRPIARHRLARTNRPPPHVTFALRPDTMTITLERANPIVVPRDGSSAPWESGVSSETYSTTIAFQGDTLKQMIHASDGQREDDFVFLDQGERLEMHVVLTADRLPKPLVYTLLFLRVH
jgi:hypothetical protein